MALKNGTSSTHHDIEKVEIQLRENLEHSSPVQYTPEQYERLCLTPGDRAHRRNLALKFGNPTPLGVVSFLLVIAPTAFINMALDGSTAAAAIALVGPYYVLGGLAQIIAGIMEWIIGNTFPSVVFITFGGHWLALGTLFDPAHQIASAFPGGSSAPENNKALMFYFAFWTFITMVYFVTSLRTNVAFTALFFNITCANALISAAYGELANGNLAIAGALVKASGAFDFVIVCVAVYLLVSLMFESVNMPFRLPLGDLSTVFVKKTKLC